MDRCKWRKVIKEAWWSGWVWVGECFFWYRPTRIVPDQRPLIGRCCCCCCCWLEGHSANKFCVPLIPFIKHLLLNATAFKGFLYIILLQNTEAKHGMYRDQGYHLPAHSPSEQGINMRSDGSRFVDTAEITASHLSTAAKWPTIRPTAITACHLIYDRALCQQMATFSEAQGCQLGQTFAPPPVQTSVLWLWFYSLSLWFRHEPPWVSAEALVWIHFIIYNLHWGCTIAKPLLVSVCPCHPWLSQEMHRLSHYFLKVHLMLHVC